MESSQLNRQPEVAASIKDCWILTAYILRNVRSLLAENSNGLIFKIIFNKAISFGVDPVNKFGLKLCPEKVYVNISWVSSIFLSEMYVLHFQSLIGLPKALYNYDILLFVPKGLAIKAQNQMFPSPSSLNPTRRATEQQPLPLLFGSPVWS